MGKTRTQKNVEYLQTLRRGAPEANKSRINDVINLYANKKITNVRTAANMINLLASKHHTQKQKALDTFNSMLNKFDTEALKEAGAQPDYLVQTGDHSKVSSHITFDIKDKRKSPSEYDTRTFNDIYHSLKKAITEKVKHAFANIKHMKIRFRVKFVVELKKIDSTGKEITDEKDVVIISKKPLKITKYKFEDVLDALRAEINDRVDGYNNEVGGSGWVIKEWLVFAIDMFKIKPARGGSYIPTPERYANPKCGLINIKNEDQKCFQWCMKYHQSEKKKNDDRTTVLCKIEDKFKYDGISYPTSYDDIAKFEEMNKVCIYVYSIDEENNVVCDFVGNNEYIDTNLIYLLRVEQDNKSHYIYIKHIERLMRIHTQTCHQGKKYCPICQKAVKGEILKEHFTQCYRFAKESTIIKLPEDGATMEFKNYKNMLERPFMVYGDLECSLCETDDAENIARHVPNSACFYFVCTFDTSRNFLWEHVGDDCVEKMIVELSALADNCIKEMQKNERMIYTYKDDKAFDKAKCCHICNQPFTDKKDKVRDHDHRTGAFRGAAHQKCNVNYFSNRYLPVVFHNLRGYDSHMIVRKANQINEQLGNKKIDCIPNSFEKFMSISIGNLKFIDSLQFMNASLEELVKNLYDPEDKFKHFHSLKSIYPQHYDLLCQKGYYPYEWVNDISKLDHEGLPPIESFYSSLTQEGISPEKYKHAENVYETMNCKTFKDYHLIYLKCDVLLLADVFEHFRKVCMNYYKLDPANYLSAPSLSWDAMLLKTGIKLDLITDIKMLDMVERMKRGGLCFVGSKRHVKANNKYLSDYDKSKPSNYLMYWDANNLYGKSMTMPLPYGNLKFDTDITIDEILATPDDSETGYFVECDLRFPKEIHDKIKEYPPCPENLAPKLDWFSKAQVEIGEKSGAIRNGKYDGGNKLVPHLFEHKNYVIHYRNLKFVKALGAEIGTIHNVISFSQSTWLKPFIDFNTEKRQNAKNKFEKEFFKLIINSIYGKTMENVRNRMQLHLTTDDENARKWFDKVNFKDSKYFNGLHIIETYKLQIEMTKPIYVGTSILDLSKLHMLEFHYNVIDNHFHGSYNLIYSDTDSLVYSMEHDDIYEWVAKNKEHFDMAESIRPDMKDETNNKVLGKFKDEMKSLVMTEFISLNPKVYSIHHQTLDEFNKVKIENKKTLKGVSKVVVKNEISHADYVKVLETNEQETRDVMSFRSYNHQVYTVKQRKIALNSFYDKQYMVDAVNNVPFGYMV